MRYETKLERAERLEDILDGIVFYGSMIVLGLMIAIVIFGGHAIKNQ
jgi:hypothetical protein